MKAAERSNKPGRASPREFGRRLRCAGRALLGLALLVASPAGGAPEVLRVGVSGDYAPFSILAPGEPPIHAGFDVTVARAYAEERGLAVEFVRFRWPELLRSLAAGRFDVAMSGVTVRPERSLAGRFSVPVAEGGAVVLVREPSRFADLEGLDHRKTRLGVNAGGHLEQVARARFRHATLVFVPDNDAVRDALLSWNLDAALTDSFEAPLWQALDPELGRMGPLTLDRKAYLVHPQRAALAADLDTWLLAREADGSLGRLRRQQLGLDNARATASPLGALLAAADERLALMPLVLAAKRQAVRPVQDRARETLVIDAGVASVGRAAARGQRPAPPEVAVRAFFRAQIEAAKQVQLSAGRDPGFAPPEQIPDLETELRPALLRIGERLAALLMALPEGLDASTVRQAAQTELRARWLSDDSRRELADAVAAVSPPAAATQDEPSAGEEAGGQASQDRQGEARPVAEQGEAPAQDGDLPGDEAVQGQQ